MITSKQVVLTGGAGFVPGPSSPIPTLLKRFAFGCTVMVSFSPGGTASYWVEVTGDPQNKPFVYWNTHDILGSGTYPATPVTIPANSNLAFPCTGVRLQCTALSGTIAMSLIYGIGVA